MTIGERIKARRLELGLSVDEVADKLGKNRATIYRYESSEIEKLPTVVLEPLSQILKVSPAYLMGWEEHVWYNYKGQLLTGPMMEKKLKEEIKQNDMLTEAQTSTTYIPVFNIDNVNRFTCDIDEKDNISYLPLVCNEKPSKEYIYIINDTKCNDYKNNMYPLIGENDLILLDFGAEAHNGDFVMIELVPGRNFFCHYYKYDDFMEFQFESHKPIRIQSDDKDYERYEVRGKVKQIIKNIT